MYSHLQDNILCSIRLSVWCLYLTDSGVSTSAQLCPPSHKICFYFCYITTGSQSPTWILTYKYKADFLGSFSTKKGSIYRPMQCGNTYAASSHNGFSWVSVLYVWILLSQMCWDTKKLIILSNMFFVCWSVSIFCLGVYLSTNALFQGLLVCCIVFSTVRH